MIIFETFGRFAIKCALLITLALALVLAPGAGFDKDAGAQIPPEKRTLYVIGSHNGIITFPLLAYVIVDDSLHLAESWYARSHDLGPVGLAVDENNENLFVSYESFGSVEVFDARDATPLGTISLFGTNNLAGMVVHQDRGELYVVDRGVPLVYVFDTTTFNQVDNWPLTAGTTPYGIDMMGDTLYVAQATPTIHYYDIISETETGNYTQTYPAVSIAVTDYPEPTVYTTADVGATSQFLTQYLLNTSTETNMGVGSNLRGVSLNPALDLVYMAQGNQVHVIDATTLSIIETQQMNFLWSSCDVLASFIPFGGTVKKTSSTHPNGKIYKGDTVTFTVAFQNRHPRPVVSADMRDVYDNTQLSFVSAVPAPDDNNDDGQLDWTDFIASLGNGPLDTGDWAEIEITFEAIEDCEGVVLEGVNTAEVSNVLDDEGTSIPDASGQMEYEINCNCRTNLDCDDGVFCNGADICQGDGTCMSPGNPCPLDDGLFCNGTETADCDEELDECGHENAPCPDDGDWCNGTEVCNEDVDTCSNTGAPCSDDGQFCNGTESCDSATQDCTHSGDPCGPSEECNESTDSCETLGETDDDDTDDGEGEQDLWPEGSVSGGNTTDCCGC